MSNGSFSIADALRCDPDFLERLGRKYPRNYDDFIEGLYDDLMRVVADLEETRSVRQKDSEDRITLDICICLRQKSIYRATHNSDASGSVDLAVESYSGAYKWIGEAKIFYSVSAVLEGFKQLTTRYSLAAPANRAGLFAYIKQPDAASCMSNWKVVLEQQQPTPILRECSRKPALQFFSSHQHVSTGLPFEVWHVAVVLHYDPMDKSGLMTKKRRAIRDSG